MIEKDFYDKYNFKVIISRPQSVFTRAFVCVHREDERKVLSSKYGKYFSFIEKGKYNEKQPDGSFLSDIGDIYSIDLEKIWEEFHPNLSFPQFKYCYFNPDANSKDIVIMPSIRRSISPRQKVNIEARGENLLSDLREKILEDFEYIAEKLYSNYRNRYFTTEEFAKLIKERYGIGRARIIANSLFELVDPNEKCVKHRITESTGISNYSLTNGNFKEYMRRSILRSRIINNITRVTHSASYSGYLSLKTDESSMTALKLLSIFDLITYEVLGGEEPEIFIRLNAPEKIKSIVAGNTPYSNNYVKKAKDKHERDIEVLLHFFKGLNTDEERWDYIEDYFLGYDVLEGVKPSNVNAVKMTRMIDKDHSYPTAMYNSWDDLYSFFDENERSTLEQFSSHGITMPDYLQTEIKKSELGENIIMSWPSKDVLICQQDTSDIAMEFFRVRGWHAYRINDIDFEKIKELLN